MGAGRRLSHIACTIQCPGSKVKSSDWLSAVALLLDKVSHEGIVSVHGDGGVDISNGAHTSSPLVKPVAFVRDSHNRDQENER